MNRRLTALILPLGLAALAGCSVDGDLTIVNDCSREIAGDVGNEEYLLEPGASLSMNIYIGKSFILGPDEKKIMLTGDGWTKRFFAEEIAVKKGEGTTYRISDDVGALYLANAYTASITDLRLKRCADEDFGTNVLAGASIEPNKGYLIKLEEGCYDLEIKFGSMGSIDRIDDLLFEVGKSSILDWYPD